MQTPKKVDLSKNNPFKSYSGNFGAYFSFGNGFDEWVCNTMLEAISPGKNSSPDQSFTAADIGAGSCYWAIEFLKRAPALRIFAFDPSEPLIVGQADKQLSSVTEVASRLEKFCMSGQQFAVSDLTHEPLDTIYFMQSAHYIGSREFSEVFARYADKVKKGSGKIVIQARNMTMDWYPWAFPFEWKEQVEAQLHATSMFGRADRYLEQFNMMSDVFREVSLYEREFVVKVQKDDYWRRLEDRWIPTFISKDIIPADLHRLGIDRMKQRFDNRGETYVSWLEKYAIVTAYV